MKPYTVDVVIPLYNGAPFIADALNSVLSQTYKATCIYVINDGSTDEGPRIVEEMSKTSSTPITLINKQNGGLSSARNAGISISKSDFIAFLDADDRWLPQKLALQLAVLETNPEAEAIYCQYQLIDEHGAILQKQVLQIDPTYKGHIFTHELAKNKIVSSGSGILIKRSIFEKAGMFDESLTSYEDWDMWIRIAKYAVFDFSPQTLVQIRQHTNNMQRNIERMLHNEVRLYNKWCATFPSSEIPSTWKDNLALSVRVGFPHIVPLMQIVNSELSQEARRSIFGIYRKLLYYIPIYLLKLCFRNIRRI